MSVGFLVGDYGSVCRLSGLETMGMSVGCLVGHYGSVSRLSGRTLWKCQ